VFWIALADDASHALSFDDLAVLTDRLDAAANFHDNSRSIANGGISPPKISEVSLGKYID
jgi:hypothetical protein